MKKFIVRFVDGYDMRFKTFETEAIDEANAVHKVYELFGDFDHWVSSVEEVKDDNEFRCN